MRLRPRWSISARTPGPPMGEGTALGSSTPLTTLQRVWRTIGFPRGITSGRSEAPKVGCGRPILAGTWPGFAGIDADADACWLEGEPVTSWATLLGPIGATEVGGGP